MATWTYSGNVYDASPPGTTNFALTTQAGVAINYLQRSHIHVYKSVDNGFSYTELSFNADYTFNTEGTVIILNVGTAAGEWIKLQRITPYQTEYVEFQASSQLTAGQLNTGERFSMYVDQELYDDITVQNGSFITDAPNDGNLYGRESEAWAVVPSPGISDAPNDGNLYGRENQSWLQVPAPGISDAPVDNKEYARLNGSWVEIPEDQSGVPEAPITTKTYGRKDAAWVEITGGGGGGGIDYKGTRDLTLPAPATSASGDLYINTASTGFADNSWTGIGGDALSGAERVIYNGTTWEILANPPAEGAVQSVVAGNDITVNSSNPANPVVSVTPNSFLTSITAGLNITVDGSTVGVTPASFIPYNISTLAALP
jgi:hypothetical protein